MYFYTACPRISGGERERETDRQTDRQRGKEQEREKEQEQKCVSERRTWRLLLFWVRKQFECIAQSWEWIKKLAFGLHHTSSCQNLFFMRDSIYLTLQVHRFLHGTAFGRFFYSFWLVHITPSIFLTHPWNGHGSYIQLHLAITDLRVTQIRL